MHIWFPPFPSQTHRGIRQLYCKCEIREHNNVDPCKRRLKVASHQSLSCLLTLKPKSFSTKVVVEWIIVQFNTIENVIMTICVSHIDSLIIYEHFGGSGGGRSKYWRFWLPRPCFFCGSFMLFLSCFWYDFVCVCLLMHCGHLLGNGWPLGSRFWYLIVKLSLSHWYPGSGVVLYCIDSWSLPSFLLSNHVDHDQTPPKSSQTWLHTIIER